LPPFSCWFEQPLSQIAFPLWYPLGLFCFRLWDLGSAVPRTTKIHQVFSAFSPFPWIPPVDAPVVSHAFFLSTAVRFLKRALMLTVPSLIPFENPLRLAFLWQVCEGLEPSFFPLPQPRSLRHPVFVAGPFCPKCISILIRKSFFCPPFVSCDFPSSWREIPACQTFCQGACPPRPKTSLFLGFPSGKPLSRVCPRIDFFFATSFKPVSLFLCRFFFPLEWPWFLLFLSSSRVWVDLTWETPSFFSAFFFSCPPPFPELLLKAAGCRSPPENMIFSPSPPALPVF